LSHLTTWDSGCQIPTIVLYWTWRENVRWENPGIRVLSKAIHSFAYLLYSTGYVDLGPQKTPWWFCRSFQLRIPYYGGDREEFVLVLRLGARIILSHPPLFLLIAQHNTTQHNNTIASLEQANNPTTTQHHTETCAAKQ
jgi:hypothetical protein